MAKVNQTTDAIQDLCRYIEDHSDEALSLAELASRAAMSRFHFIRRFKAVVGVTPGQYRSRARLAKFKGALARRAPIGSAIYDAGYGSSSRIYEKAASHLGMTPAQYRRGGEGVSISYATLDTPIGRMIVGATDRGICFVGFGESEEELVERLRGEYRRASIEPMRAPHHPHFAAWIEAIAQHLAGNRPHLDLPLDIRATAFELRVWQYLQTIPYGDVQSYGEIAAALGDPKAARAVAQACARNPAVVLIPCHRVIRGTGELGGYRFGIERKRSLIDRERERAAVR